MGRSEGYLQTRPAETFLRRRPPIPIHPSAFAVGVLRKVLKKNVCSTPRDRRRPEGRPKTRHVETFPMLPSDSIRAPSAIAVGMPPKRH